MQLLRCFLYQHDLACYQQPKGQQETTKTIWLKFCIFLKPGSTTMPVKKKVEKRKEKLYCTEFDLTFKIFPWSSSISKHELKGQIGLRAEARMLWWTGIYSSRCSWNKQCRLITSLPCKKGKKVTFPFCSFPLLNLIIISFFLLHDL